MTEYTKIDKEPDVYSKVEKRIGKGWLSAPWFYEWFTDTKFSIMTIYNKIIHKVSDYTKVDKE